MEFGDRVVLHQNATIQEYLNYKIVRNDNRTSKFCPNCRKHDNKDFPLYNTQFIDELPSVLIFALASWIDICQCLTFNVSNSSKSYILKGIIYTNRNHFTAKLIDEDLKVWYHDGQETRSLCRREQSLTGPEDVVSLKHFGEYEAILAFYAEK